MKSILHKSLPVILPLASVVLTGGFTDPQEREDISELHPEVISRVNEIAFSAHTKSPNENWWFKALGDF